MDSLEEMCIRGLLAWLHHLTSLTIVYVTVLHAVETFPSKDVTVIQQRAIEKANSGRLLEAAELFEEVGRLSKQPQGFYNAGLAYTQAGDLKAAVGVFETCFHSFSYRPCVIKLAAVYRDIEDFMKVQEYLQHAIKLDPKNSDAYSYLADTYNNLKQFKLAVEMYLKALQRSPTNCNTLLSLGDTYLNTKEFEYAQDSFRNAINIMKDEPSQRQHFYQALLGFFFSSLEIGYWKSFEVNENKLLALASDYDNGVRRAISSGNAPPPPNLLSPYRLLFFQADPQLHLSISAQWSNALASKPVDILLDELPRKLALHIGYLSRRFHDYPGSKSLS